MAIEAVKEYFAQYGIADRIMELDDSSATVELAAQALGCEPCRIAKTLSFMAGGKPVLIVTAGDAKIDNAKYKAKFGAKAKMLTPDEAEELIGHAVGGVCPFGIKAGIKEGLEGLKGRIPGLININVNTEPLPSSNCDLMLDSSFESKEALEGYAGHPKHVEVATTKVRPYTASRVCMDYEV
ncbi:MAG: Dabb family protein [Lachnospiraceae bacterium]|nr:Dabb family protein [Lachnospiraceae bacterium]